MIIRCQTVIKCSAAGADAFNNTMVHQKVEDAIDRYSIDRAAALQSFINICRGKGKAVIAHNLQNAHPVGRNPEIYF